MAVCALMHLVWRVKLAAYLIKSAAPIGAMITFYRLYCPGQFGGFQHGEHGGSGMHESPQH